MFSQTPRKQTSLVDAAQTGSVRKPLLRQQPQTPRIAGTAPSEFTLLRSGSRAIKHADIISDELTATPVSSVRPLSTEPPASVGFRMRSTASASQLQQPQQTSFRRLLLGNEKRSMGILQSLPDTWFQYFSAMSDSGLQAHCGRNGWLDSPLFLMNDF
jgi:hypothetical protein